ncbi:MAG: ABC transporter substrate-binding protein, partial [Actinobacteria bacterium]|nr:ABC transporter substrate-binding protein [Actinomycetota bacterium]
LLLPAIDQLASVEPYRFFSGEHANEAVVLLQTEAIEPIVLRGADPAQTLAEVAERVRELTSE